MKSWGITFVLIGVLTFILPYFNMAHLFTVFFGRYEYHAAIAFIVLGVVLFVAGMIRERSAPPPDSP